MSQLLVAVFAVMITAAIPGAFGHGSGYEVLPPVQLGDRMVSLEVTSSQYENPDGPDREIQFSLFYVDDKITVRDVTYHIIGTKSDVVLFDGMFTASDGILTFVLEGSESDVVLEKRDRGGFFESVVGMTEETIHVRGAPLKTGGLYKFQVEITTAGSFSDKLDPPLTFDVGLSIPERTYFDVRDPNFGVQPVSVITYYDEISDFEYDPGSRTVSFYMPFEWEVDVINQTSVVHEEITFQKAFGDMLVSKYELTVNGIVMPDRVINIDEFSADQRIVHIVINQNDLYDMLENQEQNEGMRFSLVPADNSRLSTVTGNGQFRVSAYWEPESIESGSETVFFFDITDVFLKDRPVAVDYELLLVYADDVITQTRGKSSDVRDDMEEFRVLIPEHVSGPATLQFENLMGSQLARADLPIVVDRAAPIVIPDWVRTTAGWWSEGHISDGEFAGGIEYMIENGIIKVPIPDKMQAAKDGSIPDWVRTTAGWWSEGHISDGEFAGGIEYLVSNGVITV